MYFLDYEWFFLVKVSLINSVVKLQTQSKDREMMLHDIGGGGLVLSHFFDGLCAESMTWLGFEKISWVGSLSTMNIFLAAK